MSGHFKNNRTNYSVFIETEKMCEGASGTELSLNDKISLRITGDKISNWPRSIRSTLKWDISCDDIIEEVS